VFTGGEHVQAVTRARMTALVAQWRREGGAAMAFAARHGITRAKFEYWKRRVSPSAGESACASVSAVEFRPVRLVGASAERGDLEVALATGDRVVVHAGASADMVWSVIRALRERC
jgi:hypothetical protein